MVDSLRFEALRSTNYYTWRETMQSCLILKDMWCAVEPDAEFNALEAPQKATTDRKAIALMQDKISSELKHFIRSAADAKAAWKAL